MNILAPVTHGFPDSFWLVPLGLLVSFVLIFRTFFKQTMASDGSSIVEITGFIQDCAKIFLKKQYLVIFLAIMGLSILMFLGSFFGHFNHFFGWVIFTSGVWAAVIGYFSLQYSISISSKIVIKAQQNFHEGACLLLKTGAVLVALCITVVLADIALWIYGLNWMFDHNVLNISTHIVRKLGFFKNWSADMVNQPAYIRFKFEEISVILICYSIGASIQALISKAGAGILGHATSMATTHALDVLPEDDIRNPGILADLVGRNITGVSGYLSGLFQTISICVAFGAYIGAYLLETSPSDQAVEWVFLPLIILGMSLVNFWVGIGYISTWKHDSDLSQNMAKTSGLVLLLNLVLMGLLYFFGCFPLNFVASAWVGVISSGVVSHRITTLTHHQGKFVLSMLRENGVGFGTVLLQGIQKGVKSALVPLLVILGAFCTAYVLGGGLQFLHLGMYAVLVCAAAFLGSSFIHLGFACAHPVVSTGLSLSRMLQDNDTSEKFIDLKARVTSQLAAVQALVGVFLTLVVTTAITALLISIKHWIHKLAGASGFQVGRVLFSNHPLAGHPDAVMIPSTHIFDLADLLGVTIVNPQFIAGLAFGILTVIGISLQCIRKSNTLSETLLTDIKTEFLQNPQIGQGEDLADYNSHILTATQASKKAALYPFFLVVVSTVFATIVFGVSGSLGHVFGVLICVLMVQLIMGNCTSFWENAFAQVQLKKEDPKGFLYTSLKTLCRTTAIFPDCIQPVLNTVILLVVGLAMILGLVGLKFGYILVL